MSITHPFGLALSGGGFRASAFHLGVLKRLKEVGLLEQIDFVSTVSGGSITGAYWVYWQANRGDTLASPEEWDRFESSLIGLMRSGLRGRIMWQGFFLPVLLTEILAVGVFWTLSLPIFWEASVMIAVLIGGYLVWHYRATSILIKAYDKHLFGGASLQDRQACDENNPRHCPTLIVNCTSLNSGRPVIFSNNDLTFPKGRDPFGLEMSLPFSAKVFRPIVMSRDVSFAKAVAASSCFPGAFSPLKINFANFDPDFLDDVGGTFKSAGDYKLWLIDGGVFDNQGTYPLLELDCRTLIVSDASARFRTDHRPSTWQVLPLGRGVIFRSQDIIFDCVRHLSHKRLVEREHVPEQRKLERLCYFELRQIHLGGQKVEMLSELLNYYVAQIRTDLDRFSATEISSLMYHGYSLATDEFSRWPQWGARDARFEYNPADKSLPTKLSWGYGDPEEMRIARHLRASCHRNSYRRLVNRFLGRWKNQSSLWEEQRGIPTSVKRRAKKNRDKLMLNPDGSLKLGPAVGRPKIEDKPKPLRLGNRRIGLSPSEFDRSAPSPAKQLKHHDNPTSKED